MVHSCYFCRVFVILLCASVYCCLVVICCERADHLALVCDVWVWVCFFPFGILGLVWYLIVSIPDHCPLSYFKNNAPYNQLNELCRNMTLSLNNRRLKYHEIRKSNFWSCLRRLIYVAFSLQVATFFRSLITFANSLDTIQDTMFPKRFTIQKCSWKIILKKLVLKEVSRRQQ